MSRKGAREIHQNSKSNFCRMTSIILVIVFFIYLNLQYLGEPKNEEEITGTDECKLEIEIHLPNISIESVKNDLLVAWFNESAVSNNVVLKTSRDKLDETLVIIPYIDGYDTGEKLIKTLRSISKNSKNYEKLENGVLVIFGESFHDNKLIELIVDEFIYDIQVGFLNLIKIHHSFINENDHFIFDAGTDDLFGGHVFNKENLQNPLLKTLKLLLQVHFYISQESETILVVDGNIEILTTKFLSSIKGFIKKLTKSWSIIEFSDHLSATFTGKLIRSNDLFKFIYFHLHFFSENVHKQITEEMLLETFSNYLHLMYQSNFIVSRPSLLVNRNLWGEDEYDGDQNDLLSKILKDRWRSDDPASDIITNMEAVDSKHTPIKMYGSLSGHYFHAKNVKVGDWIVLAFEDNVHLSKIAVETGLHNLNETNTNLITNLKNKLSFLDLSHGIKKNQMHELVEGILESSPKILKIDIDKKEIRCADYRQLGTVRGFKTVIDGLDNNIWKAPTKCLKLTITNVKKEDNELVIRQLAIFT